MAGRGGAQVDCSPPGSSIHGIFQARMLISRPPVEAAQILIWSYSSVFSLPMSTVIRASAFSFVGALNVLFDIP